LRVFVRDGNTGLWKFHQSLNEQYVSSYGSEQRFALDGKTIIVGIPYKDDGLIHLYQPDKTQHWQIVETIKPEKVDRLGYVLSGHLLWAFSPYQFGGSVVIRGDYMLVACQTIGGTLQRDHGEVTLFKRDSSNRKWKQIAKLGRPLEPQNRWSIAKTHMWLLDPRIALSDDFAAVIDQSPTSFDNQRSFTVNLYKLK
jgi:hypothetical protein